ncbi:hypothetical protein LN042_00075 [Kitasatospora sp. RB6PN24]|uniref:hypothetical protein n=1 Tax=Kitasatospora humi TaxID=2893891 RepID=UPI001E620A4E|nr:hypothetical protein [Kitasatospora humi]MCC9305525.1 hypothetical protein [Kitasatospora humi]
MRIIPARTTLATATVLAAIQVAGTAQATEPAAHQAALPPSSVRGLTPVATTSHLPAGDKGALDVWFNLATATLNSDGSVAISGNYSCWDDSGIQQAQLRVDFTSANGAHGSTAMTAPCDGGGAPFTAVAYPDPGSTAFTKSSSVEAHATLTIDQATGEEATDEATLFVEPRTLRADPVVNNADGTRTVGGTYSCTAATPDTTLTYTIADDSPNADYAGTAMLQLPCPAVEKAWTITITRNLQLPGNAPGTPGAPGAGSVSSAAEAVRVRQRESCPPQVCKGAGSGSQGETWVWVDKTGGFGSFTGSETAWGE